ncbi:MAG: hypothetical protein L0H39_10760, partial [Brachybacterium sp.]|nr:hypothetical protein [Brachybacterium sp.]
TYDGVFRLRARRLLGTPRAAWTDPGFAVIEGEAFFQLVAARLIDLIVTGSAVTTTSGQG